MSRKNKHASSQRRPRPPSPKPEPTTDNVLDDTVAAFTCSHGVVEDFRLYCEEELERMDMNIDFGQVAREIWATRPGRAATITAALADYISICERHREALRALRPRFAALFDENIHEHVDPVEPWRDLIRLRLYTPPES